MIFLRFQCLSKIDDSSKDRIEELVRQVADLQQQLLETQKEYLNKVKKDEVWREKQRAKYGLSLFTWQRSLKLASSCSPMLWILF